MCSPNACEGVFNPNVTILNISVKLRQVFVLLCFSIELLSLSHYYIPNYDNAQLYLVYHPV